MNSSSIKDRIRQKRLELELSQAEVASMLNISQTSFQQIEKGKTALVSKHVEPLSAILRMSERELLFGYENNLITETQELRDEISQEYQSSVNSKDRRIAELENIIKDKQTIIDFLNKELIQERMGKEEKENE